MLKYFKYFIILQLIFSFRIIVNAQPVDLKLFTLEGSKSNEQYSLNIGTGNYSTDFNHELYFLGVDWLVKDKINNNLPNFSPIGLMFDISYFVLWGIPLYGAQYDTTSTHDIIFALALGPMYLINSKIGYTINNSQIGENKRLLASIIFRSKLDYFIEQKIQYFRYSPTLGLELLLLIEHFTVQFYFGESLQYDCGWEISSQFEFIPKISLSFGYGKISTNK